MISVSEDDERAWRETVSGIKPMPKSNKAETKHKTATFKGERTVTAPLKNFRHKMCLGTISDIDGNTMRRFKREEFPVEAVLDLHGFTEERAFAAVYDFVVGSYLRHKRCVIIVTGKGLNHPDEDIFAPKGVLKDRVPQWLENDELRQLILTYIHPSERLGGQGALYILLRRNRE